MTRGVYNMVMFCIGFLFGVVFSLIVFGAGVLYEDHTRRYYKHSSHNRGANADSGNNNDLD